MLFLPIITAPARFSRSTTSASSDGTRLAKTALPQGLIPFCPFLLFASCVWADEIADRVSIDRVIAALNEVPVSPQLFTTDASSELGRLPKVSARNLRPQGAVPQRAGGPAVVISHEPWGEAT